MSLDAMKQALEVLSLELPIGSHLELKNALRAAIKQTNDWDEVEALRASLREHMAEIHRLRAAIEQAQEPVAWVGPSWLNPETRTWESESFSPKPIKEWIPLYTTPRQWQGLTADEIWDEWCKQTKPERDTRNFVAAFALAIESKLRAKNT
jgi:hypothetical protein